MSANKVKENKNNETPKLEVTQSVPSTVDEDDRHSLNNLRLELQALRATKLAIQEEMAKIVAMGEAAQLKNVIQSQAVEKKTMEFEAAMLAAKEKYSIPDNWSIDTATGKITPPQQTNSSQ